jgi:prepilin-type N-terminal cleavage/methylation domain-containing protein
MKTAFTLIELLVVITIIVGLLALLTPAIDKAIYQAELITCAGRQHGAVVGVLTYTSQYRRWYPYRAGPAEVNWVPPYVYSNDRDDRPAIFEAIQPQLLLDPFSGDIDLTTKTDLRQVIYAEYNMHFSWRYKPTGDNGKQVGREKGMQRLGDRFTWTDVATDPTTPYVHSFNLLISDFAVIREVEAQSALGGHPDRHEQTMVMIQVQDDPVAATFYAPQGQTLTASYWRNQNTAAPRPKRGLYDANYAFDDGSVLLVKDIQWDERSDRMTFIPESNNRAFNDAWGQQVPRP